MDFLVSNDDGVNAPGIAILAKSLESLGQVMVVAPDRDRSGASNSLTLDAPLRINQQLNGYWAVTGTPSDAVHLALSGWMQTLPKMVVSGINAGGNLGDDVIYSGTVAAAVEGRLLGYPAIALSLVNKNRDYQYYATAGVIAQILTKELLTKSIPNNTILNVNVPDLPLESIKGIKITRLGWRHRSEKMIEMQDPKGHRIYWIGPVGKEQDAGLGTDFHAVNDGYVSVTPLQVDLTCHQSLSHLTQWASNLSFKEMGQHVIS